MNQRVMIAMAIACQPSLLIADEPTTALDVTIQAQILELLRSLQRQRGMALVLVTHNMGVLADTAHRVAVMYAGQVVEERRDAEPVRAPQHPYTAALSRPARAPATAARLATIPGTVPGLYDRPPGCLFGPRCAYATRVPEGPAAKSAPGWAARSAATTRWAIPHGMRASRPMAAAPVRRRSLKRATAS